MLLETRVSKYWGHEPSLRKSSQLPRVTLRTLSFTAKHQDALLRGMGPHCPGNHACALWNPHPCRCLPAAGCRCPALPTEAYPGAAWEAMPCRVSRVPLLRPLDDLLSDGGPRVCNSLHVETRAWEVWSWRVRGVSSSGREGGRGRFLHWARARLQR